MGDLSETQRSKILGGNAVRCFNLHDLARKRAPFAKLEGAS